MDRRGKHLFAIGGQADGQGVSEQPWVKCRSSWNVQA